MNQFKQRREHFITQMQENSMALFSAAQERIRNNDCEYPFRQSSDFYYLTGFDEPDAFLMLIKGKQSNRTILFNRPKDKSAEIWHGYRLGQEQALSQLLVDEAYAVEEFDNQLMLLLDGMSTLYYPMFQSQQLDTSVKKAVNQLRMGKRKGAVNPVCYFDCLPILHEMRLIKSQYEAQVMAKAGEISAMGHIRAMQTCQPGMWEYQLETEIKHEFSIHGTRDVAYNSIVAGGQNGCILHYTENQQQLKDGDLVLIDAGAEYQGYAGDITRTFPINGQFSAAQKKLYQLVLDIQYAAIELIKPGIALSDVNKKVIEQLVDGLLEYGLLTGEASQLIEDESYKAFYMHGIGHYLGLDVHDVGDYGTLEKPRLLEAGMAITIEPGLYVSQDADVEDCWKGIAIRIEDDLLVTENGATVLTVTVPKEIDEIERLMASVKKDA